MGWAYSRGGSIIKGIWYYTCILCLSNLGNILQTKLYISFHFHSMHSHMATHVDRHACTCFRSTSFSVSKRASESLCLVVM